MAENENNGIVIPDELLEGIAGGTLDDTSINNLTVLVTYLKSEGSTLEEVLKVFDYLKTDENAEEIFGLINQIYREG